MRIHPGQNGSKIPISNYAGGFKVTLIGILLLGLIVNLCAACTPEPPPATPTEPVSPTLTVSYLPTIEHTPTPRPTATPTLPPLTTEGNPVTIGFILPPEDTSAIQAAEDLVALISKDTGYEIESLLYADFNALSTAIMSGDVHLFWLGPMEYLYLHSEGYAQVILLTNHLGVYAYSIQFMTNTFSNFAPYFDPEKNQSSSDSITALQQFSGTRPCLINPDSIPGHYVPLGLLAGASTPTLDPVYTYNYNATIRALYIQGICDFGVSYATIGDPLTASDIIENLPDAQDQIVVIWRSDNIIPNVNLSAATNLPTHIRYRLQEAIINLVESPQNLSLLSKALNYDVEALRTVNDPFYNPLRAVLIPLELDFEAITHQEMNP